MDDQPKSVIPERKESLDDAPSAPNVKTMVVAAMVYLICVFSPWGFYLLSLELLKVTALCLAPMLALVYMMGIKRPSTRRDVARWILIVPTLCGLCFFPLFWSRNSCWLYNRDDSISEIKHIYQHTIKVCSRPVLLQTPTLEVWQIDDVLPGVVSRKLLGQGDSPVDIQVLDRSHLSIKFRNYEQALQVEL
jgi:hypothetical protein